MAKRTNRPQFIRQPSQRDRGYLNAFFSQNANPPASEIAKILQFVQMDMGRVKIWFRNRRYAERKAIEKSSSGRRLSAASHWSQPSTHSYFSQGNDAVTAFSGGEEDKNTMVLPSFSIELDKLDSGIMGSSGLRITPIRLQSNIGLRSVVGPAPFTLEPQPMWGPSYFNHIPQEWKL
ncbi:hypothetical protein BDP27DRAFT_1446390 [Rhodocollybia butyracea]|uniref:Homeobox domain-containing protein n=1 Tax=Rhodocollybia butyracea TaxID=206335 RepID=A0A9P5PS71_9AGAR|nr:hypothetical protein BDP27DRAFT_1446390 [Rhodocollybia butyracea]